MRLGIHPSQYNGGLAWLYLFILQWACDGCDGCDACDGKGNAYIRYKWQSWQMTAG